MWTLSDLGDGHTRAHYAVRIDFGRRLGLLMRGPAGAALRGAAASSMPGKPPARGSVRRLRRRAPAAIVPEFVPANAATGREGGGQEAAERVRGHTMATMSRAVTDTEG